MNQYFENILSEIVTATENTDLYKNCFSVTNLIHYPTHLYKYRDCNNEYNFQMLEEEYLWADIPANFYDPSDALVNLKLASELPKIQKWLFAHLGELLYYSIPPKGMQSHKNGQTLQKYIEAQERFMDSKGRYSAQRAKSLMLVETRKLNPQMQREVQKIYDQFESPEFETKMQDAVESVLTNTVNILREKNLVCCLTERKENQKMWEDYADKYAGFVIEYDLTRAKNYPESILAISQIFPVTYYKRMPKVPLLPFIERVFFKALYNENVPIDDAAKKLFKQLLIKKEEYSGEEEWRIISSTNRIVFPLISAVYMGYKISDESVQRLEEICIRKSIPLYRQNFNSYTGKMQFEPVEKESEIK